MKKFISLFIIFLEISLIITEAVIFYPEIFKKNKADIYSTVANTDIISPKKQNLAVLEFPEASSTEKRIEINLKTQKLFTWQDGKILNEYLISSGKRTTPTRAGNFQVLTKLDVAYGCGAGQCWKMPFWLGFYVSSGSENGIHELPFIKIGKGWYREGQTSLGHPVSHGCVRLGIGEAEKVWNWTATGTPVIVHY